MSYLVFKDAGKSASGKTFRWTVENKWGESIGWISWYAQWRKYCLKTSEFAIYDQDCLREIADFLETKNKEHKE